MAVVPDEVRDLRQALASELVRRGTIVDPDWRAAVEATPRHEFVPGFYVENPGTTPTSWTPVTPELSGVDRWLDVAYSDTSLITQFDGGEPDWHSTVSNQVPTSSSTLPSLVVRMLHHLDLTGTERVLEIGTGTGYSTALLCHRLGAGLVASVDTDPTITRRARAALERCGHTPHLATRDGLTGWPDHGPYDRVIATCGLRFIPPAWVTQARPGAQILATMRGWGWPIGLISLTVDDHGAEGTFLADDVSFMIARQQDAPHDLGTIPAPDAGTARPTTVGPHILTDPATAPIAAIAAPTARNFALSLDGGPPATYVLDHPTASAAILTPPRRRTLDRPPSRPPAAVGRRRRRHRHLAARRNPRHHRLRPHRHPHPPTHLARLTHRPPLAPARLGKVPPGGGAGWYGRRIVDCGQGALVDHSSLRAVADSVILGLEMEGPAGGPQTLGLLEHAISHYADQYGAYPPGVLAAEVHRCRTLVVEALRARPPQGSRRELRRVAGWLSALLGNLSFHTGDGAGAHLHLGTSARLGVDVGEHRLAGWSLGAQSMVASSTNRHHHALELAEQASTYADTELRRAQITAWACLRPLAKLGHHDLATQAATAAERHMDAAGQDEPGRFGFDAAELHLHLAEAHLDLANPQRSHTHAEQSRALKTPGTAGWAAATTVLARCHAAHRNPEDACALAHTVLDTMPADSLRTTTRTRLATLLHDLQTPPTPSKHTHTLHDRLTQLPPTPPTKPNTP